jgi:hypothetical protein
MASESMDVDMVNYDASEACFIAQGDAKHDFKSEYGKPDILRELVGQLTQPTSCGKNSISLSEDKIIKKFLLKDEPSINADNIKLMNVDIPAEIGSMSAYIGRLPTNISNLFAKSVTDKYSIFYVRRTGKRETDSADDDVEKAKNVYEQTSPNDGISFVQLALQNAGITDDVFIICDVVYSALRKDLTFAGRAKGWPTPAVEQSYKLSNEKQDFYWLQTPQTQYDPGPKSNPTTDRGYGWTQKASDNSHFRFAWQNVNPGKGGRRATVYETWPGLSQSEDNALPLDPTAPEYPDNMIYSNQRLVMSVNCPLDKMWNYADHTAVLLIHDPRTQKMTYADKALAEKSPKSFSKNAFLSFFNKWKDLANFMMKLARTGQANKTQKIEFTSKYHVLAKRIGDASQAHATLQKSIPYFTINPSDMPKSGKLTPNMKNVIEENSAVSNGNHMFASYDRIAIVQAIKFGSPIVYYDQPKGNALIFISNTLLTVCKKYEQFLNNDAIVRLEKMNIAEGQSVIYSPDGKGSEVRTFIGEMSEWANKMSKSDLITNVVQSGSRQLKDFVAAWWGIAPIITATGNLVNDMTAVIEPVGFDKDISESIQIMQENGIKSLPFDSCKNWTSTLGMVNTLHGEMRVIAEQLKEKGTECELDSKEKARLEKIAGAYATLFGAVDEYAHLVDKVAFKDIPSVINSYSSGIINPEQKANESVPTRQQLIRGALTPESIMLLLPKGIQTNITHLQPWEKRQLGTERARRARNNANLDDLQREFGEVFYIMRNKTYHIDTVLRPLWQTIRNSNYSNSFKNAFIMPILDFTGKLADVMEQNEGSKNAAAMANSANKAIQELFADTADLEEVDMAGGNNGNSMMSLYSLATMPLAGENLNAIAQRMTNELLDNPVITSNTAEAYNDFATILGSVLFSQCSNIEEQVSVNSSASSTDIRHYLIALQKFLLLTDPSNIQLPTDSESFKEDAMEIEAMLSAALSGSGEYIPQTDYLFNALKTQLDSYRGFNAQQIARYIESLETSLAIMNNTPLPIINNEEFMQEGGALRVPKTIPQIASTVRIPEKRVVVDLTESNNPFIWLKPVMVAPIEWGRVIQSCMGDDVNELSSAVSDFLEARIRQGDEPMTTMQLPTGATIQQRLLGRRGRAMGAFQRSSVARDTARAMQRGLVVSGGKGDNKTRRKQKPRRKMTRNTKK